MALIGTSTGGSVVINLDYTPEFIQVIDSNTGLSANINSLSLSVAGKEILNISDRAFISAYGCWLTAASGMYDISTNLFMRPLSVANGNLPNQQTQIRLNFDTLSAGEYQIYGFSSDFGTDVVIGATNSINANANALVSDFDLLLIDRTNLSNADVTFTNGFTDRYDIDDLRALLVLSGQDSFVGYMEVLNAGTIVQEILAINNLSLFNERVQSVRLYATNNGILNFATFKAPK